MEETLPPVVNIDASLVNVQRGDVMVIRMPDNLDWEERHRIAKVIRDVLVTQGIIIPVLTLPYKWDIMMVEKGEALKLEVDQDDDTIDNDIIDLYHIDDPRNYEEDDEDGSM